MDLGLERYLRSDGFDEFVGPDGQPRPAARALCNYLTGLAEEDLLARRAAVDAAIVTMGITFTTYSDGENIDRAWPFDPIPRVMPSQRVAAHRSRPAAATDRAEPVHRRPVQRPAHRQGRGIPGRAAGQFAQLPEAVPRHVAPFWGVGQHLRHRSGARQGRHGLRAGGQPAGSLRCLVHAREPHADEVGLPGAVRAPAASCRSMATRRRCTTCWPRCRRAWTSGR